MPSTGWAKWQYPMSQDPYWNHFTKKRKKSPIFTPVKELRSKSKTRKGWRWFPPINSKKRVKQSHSKSNMPSTHNNSLHEIPSCNKQFRSMIANSNVSHIEDEYLVKKINSWYPSAAKHRWVVSKKSPPEPLKVSSLFVDPFRVVLYWTRKMMKRKEWICEISGTNKKFYILAHNKEANETKLIDLYLSQGRKLMKEYRNDYSMVVKRLRIKFDQLVLIDMHQTLAKTTI